MKRFLATLLLSTLFWAPICAEEISSLKVEVMFVGAHPDDDSMATGTLARFAPSVAVVCATRGEGGGNATGHERGKALGLVREAEQRAALAKLNISHVYYLDCQDFGFTLSAEAAEKDWGREVNLEKLVRAIRTVKPEVLFTTHPAYGHGHHRFAARLATEAFFLAADPAFCPEQLEDEGLRPWQPRKLYYAAEELSRKEREGVVDLEIPVDPTALEREREALREYRSQGWATNMPEQPEREVFVTGVDLVGGDLLHRPSVGLRILKPSKPILENQPFVVSLQEFAWGERPSEKPRLEVPPGWSVTALSGNGESSSYKVLPLGPAGTYALKARWGEASVSLGVKVREPQRAELVPAPPFDDFESWALNHGLEHLASQVPPLYVVGLGETVKISVIMERFTTFVVYRGERLGRSRIYPHFLEADLAVVPSATLPFEATIAHTDLWEGTTDDSTDLTARFGMRTEGELLHFWIQVQDDVVVANLAPDDNRSHWRTDSVELAFDPAGPGVSAHTLDTVKIGIVPFNLQGQPMAARTADAKPGPVARTLPNFQFLSRRTADGYRIEASVPLKDLGLASGRLFGFNLIVYDADKPDAAPGENANTARTAWSPWPAVQGDPRLWGWVR